MAEPSGEPPRLLSPDEGVADMAGRAECPVQGGRLMGDRALGEGNMVWDGCGLMVL